MQRVIAPSAQLAKPCVARRSQKCGSTGKSFGAVHGSAVSSWRHPSSASRAVPARASVQELQEEFGIDGLVTIKEGRGGLPMVELKHSCGSSAEVYLFGGAVISWKQASGHEILYVRPDAKFDKSKPISGGIPHCFPQFGPGEIQQHGFARNVDWEIASTSADLQPDERDPEVELVLTPSDYTREMWQEAFKVVYAVTLHGEQLMTDLRVLNEGDKPFEFTGALHSYFEVADILRTKVKGLEGLEFLDKVEDPKSPRQETDSRPFIAFNGPVDSVYLNSPAYVELDVGTGAAVAINSTGWTDTVVWNPWDAMPACYKEFCCLENAAAAAPIKVEPGSSWRATTMMEVINL